MIKNKAFPKDYNNQVFYALSIVAVCLSAIRMVYLPEAEIILIIISLVIFKDSKIRASLVIIVLCSHFMAIPDVMYRFESRVYPSIYTKAFFPGTNVKGIDILAFSLVLFNFSRLPRISNICKLPIPWFLAPIALFSMLISLIVLDNALALEQARINILFLVRNYLLLLGVYLLLSDLRQAKDLSHIALLATFTWTIKMISAILVPAENPIFRQLNAISGIMYFIGDEYLSLPIYLGAFLLLNKSAFRLRHYIYVSVCILFIVSLCLVAQRRSSIIFGTIGILMLATSSVLSSKTLNVYVNLFFCFGISVISILAFSVFFLYLPYEAQEDYDIQRVLLQSSVDSVVIEYSENIYEMMFGIGAGIPYRIQNLPAYAENEYNWGAETNMPYKTKLWGLPFDRLILNVGLIGFIIYIYFVFVLSMRKKFFELYILLSILPVFYLDSLSPVISTALATALCAFVFPHYKRKDKSVKV